MTMPTQIVPEFLLYEFIQVAGRGGRRRIVDRRRGAALPNDADVRFWITSGRLGMDKRFRIEWKDIPTGRVLTSSTVYAPLSSGLPIASPGNPGTWSTSDEPDDLDEAEEIARLAEQTKALLVENEALRVQNSELVNSHREALERMETMRMEFQQMLEMREMSHQEQLRNQAALRDNETSEAQQSARFQELIVQANAANAETARAAAVAQCDQLRRQCTEMAAELHRRSQLVDSAVQEGQALAIAAGVAGLALGVGGTLAAQHFLKRSETGAATAAIAAPVMVATVADTRAELRPEGEGPPSEALR